MADGKKLLGKITHYFSKIGVAIVKVENTIKVGDRILIEGGGKSFEQTVDSMQVDKDSIQVAKKGQEVGLKLIEPVKQNYKILQA